MKWPLVKNLKERRKENQLMKRVLYLLSLCGSILLLSGCWDRLEINDLAIVTAVAIDRIDDKTIELSTQVIIPKNLSSGNGQAGVGQQSSLTIVRSQKGKNIADAISKLQTKLPRKIFWGQCEVYIFSEELAKKGVKEQMDFLLRHPQPRERAYLFVSKIDPKKILELSTPIERYSAETIMGLSDFRFSMQVNLQSFEATLTSQANAAAIPLLEIQSAPKNEDSDQSNRLPAIIGTAVFKKDKMIGQISERTTRGVLLLRNEQKEFTVTLKSVDRKGNVSLYPVLLRTKLVPEIQHDKWKMLVKVKANGAIVQNGTDLDYSNELLKKKLEKVFQEKIKDGIEQSLKEVQQNLKTDIIGFADEFHRTYPKQWKKVENHWDEKFPTVEVKIDVDANIRRQGYINKPGAIPEKEVRNK
ncbi:spore gernimation protein GerC [Bacillus sp. AFS002410]|nr:spore gernimation protein GerC [Bacillus sp. AFS002410]